MPIMGLCKLRKSPPPVHPALVAGPRPNGDGYVLFARHGFDMARPGRAFWTGETQPLAVTDVSYGLAERVDVVEGRALPMTVRLAADGRPFNELGRHYGEPGPAVYCERWARLGLTGRVCREWTGWVDAETRLALP